MVRLAGFEPATYGLGNRCSIHLSYRRIRSYGLSHFGCSENRRRITGDFLNGFHPVLLRRMRISSHHLRILPASEFHQGHLRGPTHFHPACPSVPQTVRRHPGEISMATGTIESTFKALQLPPWSILFLSLCHKYPRTRCCFFQPPQSFQCNRVQRHFPHLVGFGECRLHG